MDLIYVSYNSEKWIDGCFDSLMKSEYNLKDIFVYVVDNASKDNTVKKLEEKKGKIEGQLGAFEIIRSTENLGFGKANNLGFSKGNSEIVCFLTIIKEVFLPQKRILAKAFTFWVKCATLFLLYN